MKIEFENYSGIKLATLDWMNSYQKNHPNIESSLCLGMIECFVKNFKEIISDVDKAKIANENKSLI